MIEARGFSKRNLEVLTYYSGNRREGLAPLAVLHDPRISATRRSVRIEVGPWNLRRRLHLTPREAHSLADLLEEAARKAATS